MLSVFAERALSHYTSGNTIIPVTLFSRSVVSDSDLMDCSPPGSSLHGISQTRMLEWVAISSCIPPPNSVVIVDYLFVLPQAQRIE